MTDLVEEEDVNLILAYTTGYESGKISGKERERAKIVEYLERAANRGHDILQGIAMIKDGEHLK
jgi:predicted house-cleaning NTP pyrophosphatase (Maf/HAM1 superfamily)